MREHALGKEAFMLEINVEETDDNLISLLDKVAQDSEIIIKRHGKRIAMVIFEIT